MLSYHLGLLIWTLSAKGLLHGVSPGCLLFCWWDEDSSLKPDCKLPSAETDGSGASSEAPSLPLCAQPRFSAPFIHGCSQWMTGFCTSALRERHLHSPNRFNFHLLFPHYFPEPCSWDPMYSQRSPSSNCSLSQNIKWCVVYKHNGHNLLWKATISLLFHCLLFILQKGATVSTFLHLTALSLSTVCIF